MKNALTLAAVAISLGTSAAEITRIRVSAADTAEGWKPRSGEIVAISNVAGSVEFSFCPDVRGWGNAGVTIEMPPDAVGFSWKEKTVFAEYSARRYMWLHEKDGDLWLYSLPKEEAAPGEWRDVVVTFDKLEYQPRGNKKRGLQTVSCLAMGLNFARQTVRIKDLEIIRRSDGGNKVDVHGRKGAPDPSARIVVLDSKPENLHVIEVLERAGMRVRMVSAADMADPGQLSRANADLVVIPCSPFFPVAAIDNFKAFLKAGGAFFAFGGYAFDDVGSKPGSSGGNILARAPDITDVNAGRFGRYMLNSRYGKPGDASSFAADVIAVFDPSFLVMHDARTVASRGQTFLEPSSEFPLPPAKEPYFAAVAMTGAKKDAVFPNVNARWIPVLEAEDRFGRRRGPVLSMVIPYAGPYAASAWAFCAHQELFMKADPAADRLLTDICRRLLSPVAIGTFKAYPHCAAPGEKVRLEATAARLPRDARCRFLCGGRVLGESGFAVGGTAEAEFTPRPEDADSRGLVTVTAQVMMDGKTVDLKETAVVMEKDFTGPTFEFKNNMFAIDGRRRFFGGVNNTGMMWYSDNEDPLVWGRDFADMADFGMKFLRILHFSAFSTTNHPEKVWRDPRSIDVTPPEKTCRQTDAIVRISAASGVGIMLVLHDWMPWELEEEELDIQDRWNRFWVGRYKDWHNVFYDIQNEPKAQRFPFPKGSRKRWTDLEVRDGERKRAAYFDRWQRRNGDAVHSANPRAAVTTGHQQNLSEVEKQLSTAGIDFINVHHYGDLVGLRSVVKLTDRRFEGKGMTLGEFGARVSHDARVHGLTGYPSAAAILYFLRVNHSLYGMGGAFSGVWDWKEFQDCTFPWGMIWQDGTPKPVLKAYRNMCIVLGEAGAIKGDIPLWLTLPDSFRLGGDTDRIHNALRSATDALLTLNVPFGVINEEGLARLPSCAKALVWPMAVCPSDAAFSAVSEFARKGGAVLVTGDFRYDVDRKPSRKARLAQLGMEADFPPLDPFSNKLPEHASVRTVGKVTWSPKAVELVSRDQSEICALYREFLDAVAKIPRLAVPGAADGDVIRFESPLEDGGRCETAVSMVDKETAFGQVRLAPNSVFWRRFSPSGGVTALTLAGEASGVKVKGAPCAMLSLDGRPLPESRAVVLLPFGPCEVTPPEGCVAGRVDGEVGEFRGRRWTTLERGVKVNGGRSISTPDDGTEYDIRLFADDEVREAAVKMLESLL